MDERREHIREEPAVERERTTVIETGGRDRGGGGGLIVAILLIGVIAVVGFLLFSRGIGGGDTDIKVDVKAPDVELPEIDVPNVAPADGNKSK